jgi:hypothetical protein
MHWHSHRYGLSMAERLGANGLGCSYECAGVLHDSARRRGADA